MLGPEPIVATDPAAELLDKAKAIVTGARRQSYGNPEDNFRCIADLWEIYLIRRGFADGRAALTAQDVAAMMALMKIARLAETPGHEDSILDLAGYAACAARCAAKDKS